MTHQATTIAISSLIYLNLLLSSILSLLDYSQHDYDLGRIPELVSVVIGFVKEQNADWKIEAAFIIKRDVLSAKKVDGWLMSKAKMVFKVWVDQKVFNTCSCLGSLS